MSWFSSPSGSSSKNSLSKSGSDKSSYQSLKGNDSSFGSPVGSMYQPLRGVGSFGSPGGSKYQPLGGISSSFGSPGGSSFNSGSFSSYKSTSGSSKYQSPGRNDSSFGSPGGSSGGSFSSYKSNSGSPYYNSPGGSHACNSGSSYKTPNACTFCFQNKEMRNVYQSHVLKDDAGRVTCPVLSRHVCPTCHATGPDAHTKSHCPQNQGAPSFKEYFKLRNASGQKYNNRYSYKSD